MDELRGLRGNEQTERYLLSEGGGLLDPGADPSLLNNQSSSSALGAPSASALDVPESVRVVTKAYILGELPPGPGDDRLILLRAKPRIESDEILRTEFIGDDTTRLTLSGREKDETSTADVRALILATRDFGQSTALELTKADWRRDSDKEELDLTVHQDRLGWPQVSPSPGGLPGTVVVSDLSPYGTPPPREGTKPSADANPPPTVSSARSWVKKREDTLLRVLTLNTNTSGNGPGDKSSYIVAIDTVIGEDGHEYFTDAGASLEGADCELGPWTPLIAPCQSASDGSPYVVGRVSSRISTLELHTKRGDVLPVHIENGWMAAFPDSSQSLDRLVGRDAAGAVLAEYSLRQRLEVTGTTTDASRP